MIKEEAHQKYEQIMEEQEKIKQLKTETESINNERREMAI